MATDSRRPSPSILPNLVFGTHNRVFRDQLDTHLKLMQRLGILSTWHDREIPPGADWEGEIDERLERSAIILFLVSANFFASDYIWKKEMTRALEPHKEGKTVVIPVWLLPCDTEGAPFISLEGLPKEKPVTKWEDRHAAWTNVA